MPDMKIDVLTEFVLKWHVPQIHMWVEIGHYNTEKSAQSAEDWFVKTLRNNWIGEIETAIIKVTQETTTLIR